MRTIVKRVYAEEEWALTNIDPEIQRALIYYSLASNFGWTPEQVDRMKLKDLLMILIILDQARKEEALKLKMDRMSWEGL